jgi:hypothetical protein
MKKILLTAVAVFTAISVYGQYEYKINKRTGRFDMVVDTAWVRTNAGAAGPDSTEAGYGLDEAANVISVDTSVIDFRARVDSLFENLTIGANTTTTATNLLVEENDSLHTMSSDYLTVNGGEAVASKLDIVDSLAHVKSGLYYIEDYGAVPNDTANDYTSEIQSCFADAKKYNGTVVGRGNYKITSTINFNKINADISGTWYCKDSTITVINIIDSLASFESGTGGRYDIKLPSVYNNIAMRNDSTVGGTSIAIKVGSLSGSNLTLKDVTGFSIGLYIASINNKGSNFNNYYLSTFSKCKKGIMISPEQPGGYCNSNNFYGGVIYPGYGYREYPNQPGVVAVYIDSSSNPVNNNAFYGLGAEGDEFEYSMVCYGFYNSLYNARLESTDVTNYPPKVYWGHDDSDDRDALANVFYGGYRTNYIEFVKDPDLNYNTNSIFSGLNMQYNQSGSDTPFILGGSYLKTILREDVGKENIDSAYTFSLGPYNFDSHTAGGSYSNFRIANIGRLYWGSSSSSAKDVAIYRVTTGQLKIDSTLRFELQNTAPSGVEGNLYASTDHYQYYYDGTAYRRYFYAKDTSTLSSRIDLKANYDSPTFTNAAYVPTASATDTSTHAANTAWVKRHLRTRYEIDSLVISGSNIIAYEGGDTLSIYVPYANRTNAAQYDAADTTGVTPDFIGQIYTNTTDSTSYVAVGLTSGGWKKITFEWIWALFIIGRITRKDEV